MTARNCILSLTSDYTLSTTATKMSWGAALEAGATFWSAGAPTRLTVPAGISRLEVFAYTFAPAGSGDNDILLQLYKNGSAYRGMIIDGQEKASFGESFGWIDVTPGDYFELEMDRFDGTNKTITTAHAFLSATTAERAGFVAAQLASDTALSGETSLSWAPVVDTLSSHDGTSGFTVPGGGVSRAIIGISADFTTLGSARTTWKIKIDGTTVRAFRYHSLRGAPGGSSGLIAVLPGEVITITADVAAGPTLESDRTVLSIEWI